MFLRGKKQANRRALARTGKRFTSSIKKHSNPYFRKKKKRKIKNLVPDLSWRLKLFLAGLGALILISVWIFLFSPLFTVKHIEVIIHSPKADSIPADLRLKEDDIRQIVIEQTKSKFLKIIPQSNLFLFNRSLLEEKLAAKFCFHNLNISKKPLHRIIVSLDEMEYAIVWQEGDKYYYADVDGKIITQANPLEIKHRQYPLVDNQGGSKIVDNSITDFPYIDFVAEMFSKAKKTLDQLNIERFIIEGELNTIKMAIENGPVIYFNTTNVDGYLIDKQLNKLKIVIQEKLKQDFLQKEYIDLRYGDRVYYR